MSFSDFGVEPKIWQICLFSFLWSIWLSKNEVVFNGKSFDVYNCFSICITRIAWWCKAKWPDLGVSVGDIVNNPSSLLWLKVVSVKKALLAWSIPSETSLIFNVDGAAVGGFGHAGIGGVLRNSENKTLIIWLEKSSSAPDAFKSIIEDIIQYGAGLDWSIKVIPREENDIADRLAKSGISRKVPFVWVCQD
ncbi:hypothetical protein V6N12_041982 [Hibiscus sabdariffa]|uniref:RNase H type-1 domain-containing protein n=1 Tax=Hibiscus sabdariffa TaxID=183260 RepID=A0ABR2EDG4_9ROSI